MFYIRHVSDDRWNVFDGKDEVVFSGTLRECEDWLDQAEVSRSARPSLLGRCVRFVREMFGAPPPAKPEEDVASRSDLNESA